MNNAISRHALALCLLACASPALAQEEDGGVSRKSSSLPKSDLNLFRKRPSP